MAFKVNYFSLYNRNLWIFVAQFTKATPQKLHRMYKKAKKVKEVRTFCLLLLFITSTILVTVT